MSPTVMLPAASAALMPSLALLSGRSGCGSSA